MVINRSTSPILVVDPGGADLRTTIKQSLKEINREFVSREGKGFLKTIDCLISFNTVYCCIRAFVFH